MADGIAHQNKDIISKILSEKYKNKSLAVYGLTDLPPIKEILPTNLPAIQLDEKRADNIFTLENDTILILEYESNGDIKSLFKYGHYAFRMIETYYDDGKLKKVMIVVIYTGNVESATDSLDLGSIQLQIRQVFLRKFDGEAMYTKLEQKVYAKERLTDEDVMKFIILPLTAKTDRQKFIEKTVDLAFTIENEEEKIFIIAGIISAADKFIDRSYAEIVKGMLTMTKVAQLYEEEKIKAINEAVNEERIEIAKTLLKENVKMPIIVKTSKLSRTKILAIKKSME